MFRPTSPSPASEPACFVVLCTAPDAETAARLARLLVSRRLAACVNVIPGLSSHYHWDDALREDPELLLLAKTDGDHLAELIEAIEQEHPYECPEAIALPISAGSSAYLEWIRQSLRL